MRYFTYKLKSMPHGILWRRTLPAVWRSVLRYDDASDRVAPILSTACAAMMQCSLTLRPVREMRAPFQKVGNASATSLTCGGGATYQQVYKKNICK